MKKVIVPSGSKINLTTLFEDLQDYLQYNIKAILDQLFESYGVNIYDTSEDDLKVIAGSSPGHITIKAGNSISSGGYYFNVTQDVDVQLTTAGAYQIWLVYYPIPFQPTSLLVNNGVTTIIYTREFPSYAIGYSDPGDGKGILLAQLSMYGGIISNLIDKRSDSLLKLKTDILRDNVIRTDLDEQSINGILHVDTLSINNNPYALSLTGDGLNTNFTISGLQFQEMIEWRHTHSGIFNPFEVDFSAAEVNTLFNNGIIDFSDGYGLQQLITTPLMWIPGNPTL